MELSRIPNVGPEKVEEKVTVVDKLEMNATTQDFSTASHTFIPL